MTTVVVVVSQTIEIDFDESQCGADGEVFAERLAEIIATERLKVEAPGLRRLTLLGVDREIV